MRELVAPLNAGARIDVWVVNNDKTNGTKRSRASLSENFESIHNPAASAILRRDKTATNNRRDGGGYFFSSNGATSRRTTS